MNTEIFLVDTNVWIHIFRQSAQQETKTIQEFFRLLSPEAKIVTTGIVLTEIICGLRNTKKDKAIREIIERYDFLPSTKDIYILAGDLGREMERKGLKIPVADYVIAATAITYGATLISGDPHFKRFAELNLRFIG